MARLTDTEIQEALAVCEKATPGPWDIDDGNLTLGHWGDEWEPIAEPPFDGRDAVDVKRDLEFCALARTILPRALEELVVARKDTDLLDGAADIRIVDGFGDMDIDEMTSAALPKDESFDDEGKWKLEWRKQFRAALRAAIDAARGSE